MPTTIQPQFLEEIFTNNMINLRIQTTKTKKIFVEDTQLDFYPTRDPKPVPKIIG